MPDEKKVEETAEVEATATDDKMEQYEVEGDDFVDESLGEATAPTKKGDTNEQSEGDDEDVQKDGSTNSADALSSEHVDGDNVHTPKHKTGDQRFHDLTQEKYEAVADAKVANERYQATLQELDALKNPPKTETKPEKLVRPLMPTRESVDYDEAKYAESMNQFYDNMELYQSQQFDERYATKDTERLQRTADTQRQRASEAVDDVFFERQTKFLGQKDAQGNLKFADYADVVFDPEFKIPTVVVNAAKGMDNGPELLYSIAKSPKLTSKLVNSTDAAALVELGRLCTNISTKTKTKRVSNTPTPITPLSGKGDASLLQDEETMPMGDFMQKMNKDYYDAI